MRPAGVIARRRPTKKSATIAWKGKVRSAQAATVRTPKNEATKIANSDGGSEINDDIRVSRTKPRATRTGYVKHAANREREAMHSIRIRGTISDHVSPSQIQMIGSAISAKKSRNGHCTTAISSTALR